MQRRLVQLLDEDKVVLEQSHRDLCVVIERTTSAFVRPKPSNAARNNGLAKKKPGLSRRASYLTPMASYHVRVGERFKELPTGECKAANLKTVPFHAVFGIYELLSGPYIALIRESKQTCSRSMGAVEPGEAEETMEFRRASMITILPLFRNARDLSPTMRADEDRYLDYLYSSFSSHVFYFSYRYDVTSTLQRRAFRSAMSRGAPKQELWRRASDRFFWNREAVQPLIDAGCGAQWVTPVMSAFIEVRDDVVVPGGRGAKDHKFTYLFISRRSKFRAGTRFWRRGLDFDGHAANEVETEQALLFDDGTVQAHVQLRGSIPVIWKSPVTLKYAPKVVISEDANGNAMAFREHMAAQALNYCIYGLTRDNLPTVSMKAIDAMPPPVLYMERSRSGSSNASNSSPNNSSSDVRNSHGSRTGLLGRSGKKEKAPKDAGSGATPGKTSWRHRGKRGEDRATAIATPAVAALRSPTRHDGTYVLADVAAPATPFEGWNGRIVCVNLVDCKGSQEQLGEAFKDQVDEAMHTVSGRQNMPGLTYVWFDFHRECSRMRWGNLAKLLERLRDGLRNEGYFYQLGEAGHRRIVCYQSGVVRTNCMDNLDRTNVVQSLIARHVLLRCLAGREGVAGVDQGVKGGDMLSGAGAPMTQPTPVKDALDNGSVLDSGLVALERVFKDVWGNNADAMSMLYAGSGALKTDFTRTGRRTIMGRIADLRNSVWRYYVNNFCDGARQDSIDLMLMNYNPRVERPSPFAPLNLHETVASFCTKIYVIFSVVFASSLVVLDRNLPRTLLLSITTVAAIVAFTAVRIFRSGGRIGTRIVAYPRLVSDRLNTEANP
uniref:SAC domain-containing protein n=1 Tax=Phaeomonas parva TaxID=124430 RepID=A0A7S1UKE5_9STRA